MINNTSEIKQLNQEKIREIMLQHEQFTKAEIAQETGLSVATCSTILNEMAQSREIIKTEPIKASVGRPAYQFVYNVNYQHVLIFALRFDGGVTSADYAVADGAGRMIRHAHVDLGDCVLESMDRIAADALAEDTRICAIGVGIPGYTHHGRIAMCDIKPLEKVDLVQHFLDKFGLETIVENDVNIITYWLYYKQAVRRDDVAVIYFPYPEPGFVGSGFIVNGRILRGKTQLAGELSYVARAYGIPNEQQTVLMGKREEFQVFASQLAVAVTAVINPALLVFMGNHLGQTDIERVREHCLRILPEHHLPVMQLDNNLVENYVNGSVRITLNHLQFRISH